jgi:hypothetical protein
MVVSFVIIGELWLMLMCSAGSRGVRLGPQNVETRWRTPSIRTMLALKAMRILAAMMLSLFCGPRAPEAKQATEKFGTGQERRTSGAKARVVVELLRPD